MRGYSAADAESPSSDDGIVGRVVGATSRRASHRHRRSTRDDDDDDDDNDDYDDYDDDNGSSMREPLTLPERAVTHPDCDSETRSTWR